MIRLPKTTYDAKYPWNAASVSRAGHIFEIDDTPGKERLRTAHKSGTYWEVSPDGKKVEYVVGHNHQYNKGGLTMTIDENGDIKSTGHMRMVMGGGSHVEVRGDASVTVGGDCLSVVMKDMKASVVGDLNLKTNKNCNLNVTKNWNVKVSGDTTMETTGTHTIKAAIITMNPA